MSPPSKGRVTFTNLLLFILELSFISSLYCFFLSFFHLRKRITHQNRLQNIAKLIEGELFILNSCSCFTINQWLLIVTCQLLMIIKFCFPNDLLPTLQCFHKNPDSFLFSVWFFISGAEDDGFLRHCFSYGISLKPGRKLGMKAIDTRPNFSAAL